MPALARLAPKERQLLGTGHLFSSTAAVGDSWLEVGLGPGSPPLGDVDQVWFQVLDGGLAAVGHRSVDLFPEQFQDAVDAIGPVDGQPPEEGTPDANGPGSHSQRLDDVAAAADAGVDVHFAVALHRIDDLREHLDCAHGHVQLASTVSGYQDAVDTAFGGDVGVLGGADALEDQGQAGEVAEPIKLMPSERNGAVDVPADRLVGAAQHILRPVDAPEVALLEVPVVPVAQVPLLGAGGRGVHRQG